jgi:flagellum-specific peptidoglycan hydrolase FlgJ
VFEGKEVTITANFKSYEDMTESFLDYARFLTMNPRYVKAFAYAKDIDPRPTYYPKTLIGRPQYNPEQFLSEVISAGYATDPTYVSKVAGMWKNWDEQRLLSA